MLRNLSILALLSVSAAFADTVIANNAGPLPASAEDLSSDASLTQIAGSLFTGAGGAAFPNFESIFKIDILNYQLFSAQTVPIAPHGIADTDLFLLDANGNGVYANDDISGGDTLSLLPAHSSVGPTANGIYYLAIAISTNTPQDANGNDLFALNGTDVVGPNGTSPMTGWDNGAFTQPDFDNVNYNIVLTGTSPEPATWLLLAAPLLALFCLRNRRPN